MEWTCISPEKWDANLFQRVGKDWMLITAGDTASCNTMTASWGGFGVLWNKPGATCYVRPSRHTYGFMENSAYFSLSFFPDGYREALTFCGRNSGRDVDKFAETGLEPCFDFEAPCIAQADTVVICRKRYADDIEPGFFTDGSAEKTYPEGDFHRFYIGEIIGVYQK